MAITTHPAAKVPEQVNRNCPPAGTQFYKPPILTLSLKVQNSAYLLYLALLTTRVTILFMFMQKSFGDVVTDVVLSR